jgi:hypothetical protein
MHKFLLAMVLVAGATPAVAQQVPMASTDNPASSVMERNGNDSYSSDPSAQIAPGEDAATMDGTTRMMTPQSRRDHGCHGSERVELPALTN